MAGIVATSLLIFALPAGFATAKTFRLVALGDSLSAGYGLAAEDAFPVKLERALRARGHQVVVENAGVSGDTASGGLQRLDWVLGDQPPDAVILELGANDALRAIDPAVTRKALDAILTKLGQRKLPVLLAGMLAPPNLGARYGAAFAAIYKDLALAHKAVFYPFFLDGVAGAPDLLQSDGLHPKAAGVDEIVRRILPFVETLLKRARHAAGGSSNRQEQQ